MLTSESCPRPDSRPFRSFPAKFWFGAGFLLVSAAGTCVPALADDVKPTDVFADATGWQWDPSQGGINIAELWARGITGEGVVIGIHDSNIDQTHPALTNVSAYNPSTNWDTADLSAGLSYNFSSPGSVPASVTDPNIDHGTWCAGLAAAPAGKGNRVVGAAPGATIAGLRGWSNYSNAYYWASGVSSEGKYQGEAQIDVKSCSYSLYYGNASGDNGALQTTSANGVIYCFAAGNGRKNSNECANAVWNDWGNVPTNIMVAATNTDGKFASMSAFGSNIFIAAPGMNLISTCAGGYAMESGTSASAPIVAGVIALGKQVCSVMDSRWAKHALAWSSGHNDAPNIDADDNSGTGTWTKNKGGYWFNNNYGFGLVDPVGFVDAAQSLLYTTTETSATFSVKDDDVYKGRTCSQTGTSVHTEYELDLGDALAGKLESVSLKVNFLDTTGALNLTTLDITLVSPDGVKSVLLKSGAADLTTTSFDFSSYTFLTNAFWGSDYSGVNGGTWKIVFDYAGAGTGNIAELDWVTFDEIKFRMGEAVFESDDAQIAAGTSADVYAVALDSGNFAVNGVLRVEDTVAVNAGRFVISETGTLAAYTDGVFGEDKGVKYEQSGGNAEIRGKATFKRGVRVDGGELVLAHAISAGEAGIAVGDGGTLTAAVADALSGNEISLESGASLRIAAQEVRADGKIVLAEGAKLVLARELLAGVPAEMLDGAATESFLLKILVGEKIFYGGTDSLAPLTESNAAAFAADYVDASAFSEFLQTWAYADGVLSVTLAAIPEPSSFGLFAGTLVLALAASRRRRKIVAGTRART